MNTFDNYLKSVLYLVANNYEREFNSSDVKAFLKGKNKYSADLDHLYFKQCPSMWRWNSFNDRMHRHLNKAVKNLGGARQKIGNRVVYKLPKINKTTHSFLFEPKHYKYLKFGK